MKKIIPIFCCLFSVLIFSACSMPEGKTTSLTSASSIKKTGSVIKSFDGGKNWENKIRITETSNIGNSNILSMAINPANSDVVYSGTEKDGLFVTRNGGDNWEKLVFPLTRIYGLAINQSNVQTIYASGVLDKRAKIFKSADEGKNWVEIYTEPSNNSVISSLAISKKDSRILYSGTSEGTILKSSDGGQSWKNITKASGPVIDISFDAVNEDVVYFGVSNGTLLKTDNGGVAVEDLQKKSISNISEGKIFSFNVYSVETDPSMSGVVYVGTKAGIFKSTSFGNSWNEVNILESSKKFPIRAIAVNPENSSEIIYSNSGVVYRSSDNGATWFTFQLNTEKNAEVIEYNPTNVGIIYAGLRKI